MLLDTFSCSWGVTNLQQSHLELLAYWKRSPNKNLWLRIDHELDGTHAEITKHLSGVMARDLRWRHVKSLIVTYEQAYTLQTQIYFPATRRLSGRRLTRITASYASSFRFQHAALSFTLYPAHGWAPRKLRVCPEPIEKWETNDKSGRKANQHKPQIGYMHDEEKWLEKLGDI